MKHHHIFNDFYFGRTLPHAVITLDSPTFGAYEAKLLQFMFPRQQKQPSAPSSSSSSSPLLAHVFHRPLFICADGSFRKVHRIVCSPPDIVIGDLDSLKPPQEMIGETVRTVADYVAPRNSDELAIQARKASPYIVKVLDQNTTDFEKCLALCEQMLCGPESKSCEKQQQPKNVLVLGGDGGEWHHQMAVIHAAAKFSGEHLSVRLHSAASTIMFCAPNGRTEFKRNAECESDVFSIVPFGRPPKRIVTTGLKWDVDFSVSSSQLFGWSRSNNKSFISTSNRFADGFDGVVTLDLQSDPDCAVAISVNNGSDYLKRMLVGSTAAGISKL